MYYQPIPNDDPNNINRNQFIRLMSSIAMIGTSNLLFGKSIYKTISDIVDAEDLSEDKKLKTHFAIARALSHKPPKEYKGSEIPGGQEYLLKRTTAINLIAEKAANNKKFEPGEFQKVIMSKVVYPALNYTTSISPLWDGKIELTKDQMTALSLGTNSLAVFATAPAAVIGLSALGLVTGWKAYKAPDDATAKAIHDGNLLIAQNLWNDPATKKIMTQDVTDIMRDVFGIDFNASLTEHKNYLPDNLKNYVDIAVSKAAIDESTLSSKIIEQVNKSFSSSVNSIIEYINEQQKQQEIQQKAKYINGEIQGSVYLVTVLTDKLLGSEASNIVNTVADSAIKASDMLANISLGLMGPVGAVAGFTNIAIGLVGLFSNKEPTAEQLILSSVKEVQKSIRSLHQDMDKWFGVVVENQQRMMDVLVEQLEFLHEQNGKNHLEVMVQLTNINQKLNIAIADIRDGNIEAEEKDFKLELSSLDTQIISKKNGASYSDEKIKSVIDFFHIHGMDVAQHKHFLGILKSNAELLEWDPMDIIANLNTINSVNNFVGYVPTIVNHFTGNKLEVPYNPRVLGNAASALALAYMNFPKIAKRVFEVGNRRYLFDLNKAICTTKDALSIATSNNTIEKVKEQYSKLLEEILSGALDKAYEESLAKKNIDKDLNVIAAGPLNKISYQGSENQGDIADEQRMISSHFFWICKSGVDALKNLQPLKQKMFIDFRDRSEGFSFISKNIVKENDRFISDSSNLRLFIRPDRFIGIDQLDERKVCEISDLFDLAKRFKIVQIDKVPKQTRLISFRPKSNNAGMRVKEVSATEEFISSKFTFLPISGEEPIIIGDDTNKGWRASKIKSIEFTCSDGYKTTMEDYDVQYLSDNLVTPGRSPFTALNIRQDPAISLLYLIRDRLNLFYEVRNEIIVNSKTYIQNHPKINEFEAVGHCLKYLAGLNTYVKTGDLELGKSLAKDKVYFNENKALLLPSDKEGLVNFVSVITSKEYLYEEKSKQKRGGSDREIRAYIKEEAQSILDEYVSSVFPSKLDQFRVPELEIPRLMLSAMAQKLNIES